MWILVVAVRVALLPRMLRSQLFGGSKVGRVIAARRRAWITQMAQICCREGNLRGTGELIHPNLFERTVHDAIAGRVEPGEGVSWW